MNAVDLLLALTETPAITEFYSWVETQNVIDPSAAFAPTIDELLAWYNDEPDYVEALAMEVS